MGTGFGKGSHVFGVASRKAPHIRKFRFQVNGQMVNDLGAPPFFLLLQDGVADFSINSQ
jgi:hypothetical protein